MANKLTENKAFLGRGWAFPVEFTQGYHSARLSQFEDDIRESLIILLSTIKGERVMRSDYGTTVHNLIFEPLDVSTGTLLAKEVEDAILLHEPRVFVNNIDVNQSSLEGFLELSIDYTVIPTNTRYNLVYPFYRSEGTDIQL